MSSNVRMGIGYDIHRIIPGERIVVGGEVVRPGDDGTDNDVLTHALIDAMMGAATDGDVGSRYPPDALAPANGSVVPFLADYAARFREIGYHVLHVDSNVVLGPVRLSPSVARIRHNLSRALDLDIAEISVKPRSNDGIGELGTGAAVASHVLVTCERIT